MLYFAAFLAGVTCGVVGLVFHATRPRGYKANNGNRYRLSRVD